MALYFPFYPISSPTDCFNQGITCGIQPEITTKRKQWQVDNFIRSNATTACPLNCIGSIELRSSHSWYTISNEASSEPFVNPNQPQVSLSPIWTFPKSCNERHIGGIQNLSKYETTSISSLSMTVFFVPFSKTAFFSAVQCR